MEPNLTGGIHIRSFISIAHFVLISQQIWLPRAIPVSDWLIQRKFISGQMEPNFIGGIYIRSFIRIAHFIHIWQQTWPLSAVLVSDWLIKENTFLLKQQGKKMKPNWIGGIFVSSLIKIAHFVLIRQQTWPSSAILISYWLKPIQRKLFTKPEGQMETNLKGGIFIRSSKNIAYFFLIW